MLKEGKEKLKNINIKSYQFKSGMSGLFSKDTI